MCAPLRTLSMAVCLYRGRCYVHRHERELSSDLYECRSYAHM